MAGFAKHIQVAVQDGDEAGLKAFMAAPSSRRWDSYKLIASKRKDETRLAAYCKQFKTQLAEARAQASAYRELPEVERKPAPTVDLSALLGKKVQIQTDDEPYDQEKDAPEESVWDKVRRLTNTDIEGPEPIASRKAPVAEEVVGDNTRKDSDRPQVVPGSGVISSGIAWATLNQSGDFPFPANPDGPANNGQLYRLNMLGLMGDAVMAALDPTIEITPDS